MHTYKYGASVTLTATPAANYDLKEWEIEGLEALAKTLKNV
jgi:hypothetical protein